MCVSRCGRRRRGVVAVIAVGLVGVCGVSMAGRTTMLNIVPFGEVRQWAEDGTDYGVMWEDQRELHRVVVTFAEDPPERDAVALEYWQSSWPHRAIPREAPSGAGSSGWMDVGDWFQGEWQRADADVAVDGATWTFTFRPLNAKEFPDLEDLDARYRTTLKLRLVGEEALPAISSFEAYTDTVCEPLEFEVAWEDPAPEAVIEVFNGTIEEVGGLDAGGLSGRIQYAVPQHYHSFDETVVTVRAGEGTFSFAPKALIEWGHIVVPDLGVLVRRAGEDVSYEEALRRCRESEEKDVYSRVLDEPEQTLTRAWADTPEKGRHYIPLSFEGGRQHFGLNERGDVWCDWGWIGRLKSTDSDRCLWDGKRIEYRFRLPKVEHLVDRRLVDGCLPIVETVWEHEGVRYTETAFVIPLAGVPAPGVRILAEDPLVMMVRIDMEAMGGTEAEARLDIDAVHGRQHGKLVVDGDRLLNGEASPRQLRMVVSDAPALEKRGDVIAFRKAVTASSPARLDVAIPYITLTEPEEGEAWAQLRALRFDDALDAVGDYWRGRVAAGARIHTPEPMVNDFYQAHVSHLLINTEREIGGADRYMAKVGTFGYGVYANESCMMVSDLDRRGFHERAQHALESWLHYQGSVGLPGDFSSAEGQLYGVAGYESGGYNQHHGWVLWCLGEHYWYTRDRAWLERVAPKVVAGCEWAIRERGRTIEEAKRSPIRAIERGLLPPGRLEDIGDWRCWLSTNVYTWWGMDNAARALCEVGHPEGERLLEESEAYKADLLAAFQEASRRSPVVRLRDGTWIPHVPAEVHRRGRSFGWITETLEGAIHLVRCGALEPWDPVATWIVRDFEDNLYISEQFGYNITGADFERHWFSRGGISMQANLLCNPIPYLLRDEPEHFLRAYFNAFAVSYFPDTRMMTEHALPNIGDWRGDHYKCSDEANSTYWLRLMFVQERGDDLWLGAALPRTWLADGQRPGIENAATYFGTTSLQYESKVGDGRIEASLEPPWRNPPARILVRFRHPAKARMVRCEVNGAPWTDFDADGEWVELTGCSGSTKVVAYYGEAKAGAG